MLDLPTRPRILVADDDDDVRGVIVESLIHIDKDVIITEASNGQEALDMVRIHNPHVVILDLIMPFLDGYTALDELRATHLKNWIPVMVLTGYGDRHLEADVYRFGADAYLEKPVLPMKLKANVHALLRQKARYDDLAQKVELNQGRLDRLLRTLDNEIGTERVGKILLNAGVARTSGQTCG